MNILGEGLPKTIIDQVEIRQKVYGYGYLPDTFGRTNESIAYLNSNTAWCKLVSSVNIVDSELLNNEIIKSLGYEGDDLAKLFVLSNGTRAYDDRSGKSGLDYAQNDWEAKAYNNWGIPSADFGFRPMAGIQSVTVKHKNRGSIRAATVNIKAWDKVSFEIIDILYLRLGFTILLEWGNTLYLEHRNTELVKNQDNSLAEEFLNVETKSIDPKTKETTTQSATYYTFLDRIQQQRILSLGNYDAMLGRVSNLHWSFQPDGSYDIVLDIISIGDVVESFKIKGNATSLSNSSNVEKKENTPSENEENKPKNIYKELQKYAPTNDIIDYLYRMINLININTDLTNIYLYNISNTTDFSSKYWQSGGEFENASKNSTSKQYPNGNPTKDGCLVVPSGDLNSNYSLFFFIRLGNLLKFLEEAVMYSIETDGGESIPILRYDYSVDDNLMHAPPQLMSYDPSVCMVRKSVRFPNPSEGLNDTVPEREYFNLSRDRSRKKETTNFADPFMVNNLPETGKIMNIYVNAIFILNLVDELTNKDTNELSLIDFLRGLLAGINSAFAGYSKLDLFIDENKNTIKIIDQNPLPSTEQTIKYLNNLKYIGDTPVNIPTNTAKFELYGYAPPSPEENISYPKAGFIKEFSFTTELTPEFSTMINASATAQGNVIGENNTALSKLNQGLEDKYKKTMYGGGDKLKTNEKQKLKDIYDAARKEYYGFANSNLKTYLNNLYNANWLLNEIPEYKSAATTYFKLYKKYKKATSDYFNIGKPKNTTTFQPGTGFIPFNLSLKMDGISGIKIGSRFNVDTSYLPSNYPTTIEFLVKSLSHEIKDNRWTTLIESFTIAKSPTEYKSDSEAAQTAPTTTTAEVKAIEAPSTGPGDRSRCAIKTIGVTKYVSRSEVYAFFKKLGYSKAAVAGIIANLESESGLNLNAFNKAGGGCGAYGLAQWRGARQTNLNDYAKSISQPVDSAAAQLGYLSRELTTTESSAGVIKSYSNPREAAFIFASRFERFPGASDKTNSEVIKRMNLAGEVFVKI